MIYKARLTADFLIEAENVVWAKQLLERIHSVGELQGCKRLPSNRDSLRYSVTRLSETVEFVP